MVGEEKRHQMMQNLFGDQSEEEEEEEEEVESEHESNRQPDYASDDADGGVEPEGEGDVDVDGEAEGEGEGDGEAEGEGEVEGQGEAEMESEGEMQDVDPGHGESEGERDQSSQEVEVGDQRVHSEGRDSESDEKEEYGQRVVTSRRREVIDSESERSEENQYADNEDEEVNQARSPSRSPGEEKDEAHISSAPIRDVFGDSEDEEEADYVVQNQIDEEQNISPMEEENSYGNLRPDDIIPEDDGGYGSEEHVESKTKEKPVGPPLELEIPLRQPPAYSDRMSMIKVSNIMGIDPKPFDPETYVEEDVFETDESGSKKRISLVNNIVRWRKVKKPDGTTTVESNARFVEWSDGSVQLMIGNEVLDISVQDAQHDQSHLFLRHGKGILQSQGRILNKMRFMPSSLTSNSHRLLTALVDSRHKKVYKVKNCFTDIDPEREKEQKEKAESQNIRASVLLNRKKEKVSRKYMPTLRRERQLSPGFLEDAPEEEEETDDYDSRRSAARRRFEEDLEMEAQAEKRIINAKKRDIPRQTSFPSSKHSRRPVDFDDSEKEESEYETEEEEERSPPRRRAVQEEEEPEYEEEQERDPGEEEEAYEESEEEAEEPKQNVRESASHKRKEIESDEESPPRKNVHRRMAIVYDSDEE
ncbi:protein LEO1 isoform X1 [Capsicum chacoense]